MDEYLDLFVNAPPRPTEANPFDKFFCVDPVSFHEESFSYRLMNDRLVKPVGKEEVSKQLHQLNNFLQENKDKPLKEMRQFRMYIPYQYNPVFPKKSNLTYAEMEDCYYLTLKCMQNASTTKDAEILSDFLKRLAPERTEYQTFTSNLWRRENFRRYVFIPEFAKQLFDQFWQNKLNFVISWYPKFFDKICTVPLVYDDLSNPIKMELKECLLSQGKPQGMKVPFPKEKTTLKADDDLLSKCKTFHDLKDKMETYQMPVSRDEVAVKLAVENEANFVLSSSSFKKLVDNHFPNFAIAWELPISVKEYNNGKSQKRVIFIDKALPSKNLTAAEKSKWFAKKSAASFLHAAHRKMSNPRRTVKMNDSEKVIKSSPSACGTISEDTEMNGYYCRAGITNHKSVFSSPSNEMNYSDQSDLVASEHLNHLSIFPEASLKESNDKDFKRIYSRSDERTFFSISDASKKKVENWLVESEETNFNFISSTDRNLPETKQLVSVGEANDINPVDNDGAKFREQHSNEASFSNVSESYIQEYLASPKNSSFTEVLKAESPNVSDHSKDKQNTVDENSLEPTLKLLEKIDLSLMSPTRRVTRSSVSFLSPENSVNSDQDKFFLSPTTHKCRNQKKPSLTSDANSTPIERLPTAQNYSPQNFSETLDSMKNLSEKIVKSPLSKSRGRKKTKSSTDLNNSAFDECLKEIDESSNYFSLCSPPTKFNEIKSSNSKSKLSPLEKSTKPLMQSPGKQPSNPINPRITRSKTLGSLKSNSEIEATSLKNSSPNSCLKEENINELVKVSFNSKKRGISSSSTDENKIEMNIMDLCNEADDSGSDSDGDDLIIDIGNDEDSSMVAISKVSESETALTFSKPAKSIVKPKKDVLKKVTVPKFNFYQAKAEDDVLEEASDLIENEEMETSSPEVSRCKFNEDTPPDEQKFKFSHKSLDSTSTFRHIDLSSVKTESNTKVKQSNPGSKTVENPCNSSSKEIDSSEMEYTSSRITDKTNFTERSPNSSNRMNVSYLLWDIHKEDTNSKVLMRSGVRSFKLIIRTKSDGHLKNKFQDCNVNVTAKVEYCPEYGASCASLSECTQNWASLFIKPNSNLIRLRAHYLDHEVLMTEELAQLDSCHELQRLHNVKPQTCFNTLYSVLSKLADLSVGDYILRHEPRDGAFAVLFKAARTGFGLYNLHGSFQTAFSQPPVNESCPYQPIDTFILTPYNHFQRRIPATFPPSSNKKVTVNPRKKAALEKFSAEKQQKSTKKKKKRKKKKKNQENNCEAK